MTISLGTARFEHIQKSTCVRNPTYPVKSFTEHKLHSIILFYKSSYTYLTQPTFYFSFFFLFSFFFSSAVSSQFPSNIFLSSTQERHCCSFTQKTRRNPPTSLFFSSASSPKRKEEASSSQYQSEAMTVFFLVRYPGKIVI